MIKIAGVLITLCGVGHTLGALVQTVPRYGAAWFGFALWESVNTDLIEMTHVTAGFWFTMYSFGPLLLLLGATVLWLGFRHISPPPFVAWSLAGWVVITEVLSGPSPLLLLLPAAALLLVAAFRHKRSADSHDVSLQEVGTV